MVMPLLSKPLFLIIDVILALVILATILIIVTSAHAAAQNQRAYANVIKLKSTIEDVYQNGGEKTIEFELPQTSRFPSLIGKHGWIADANIEAKGDPNHVLYYESFPPGEAISWELYLDLQERTVSYYDSSAKPDKNNIWGNVILSGMPESKLADITLTPDIPGDIGKWDENKEIYRFSGYSYLDSREKTSVKYRTCGDNSLCYKTPEGIRRLKLDCPDLEYIAFNKHINFHLVSPCKASAVVRACTSSPDEPVCVLSKTYPLYKYDKANNELIDTNENTIKCFDSVSTSVNPPQNKYDEPDHSKCIEIYLKHTEGCRTTNGWWLQEILNKIPPINHYEKDEITLYPTNQFNKAKILDYFGQVLGKGEEFKKWRFGK